MNMAQQIKAWKSSKYSIKIHENTKIQFDNLSLYTKSFFDIKTDIVVMLTFSVDKKFFKPLAVACFSCYTPEKNL